MKHKLIYLIALIVVLASCDKKTDELFDQPADVRIEESLKAYQQALTSAPYGWRLVVQPKGLESQGIQVGGFSYYVKFNNENRVTMYSDFDLTTASTPKQSGYRLKAVQRPSIYFDTYGYINIPSDPAAAVSKTPSGEEGTGWGSDFDFSFLQAKPTGDTIQLKGNFNNSDAFLIKLTQQEEAAYINRQLETSLKLLQNLRQIGYFKVLTVGNLQYYITVDEANRLVVFSWVDGSGNVQSFTTGYYSTLTGIALTQPFSAAGGVVIRSINFLSWNAGGSTMSVNINNQSASGTIADAGQPLKVNVNAARQWWETFYGQDNYWISVNGFTVNGVQDAYGLTSIPNFYFLTFWTFFGSSGGVNYDLLGFVKVNDQGTALTLPYGAAYFSPPDFTSDGRVIFSWLGTLGNVPNSDRTPYENTAIQMEEPNGYYLIQTSPTQYDMVSRDGKSWITWQR